MKKKFTFLLTIVMVCMTFLIACDDKNSSGMGGTSWKLTSIESEQGTLGPDIIEASDMSMVYEFKKDGTVISDTFTDLTEWKQEGNTLSISSGDKTIDCTIDGDKFTIEINGYKAEFTKQ